MTNPTPTPEPAQPPPSPPTRIGYIHPTDYTDLLTSYACVEDRFRHQALTCAVREQAWGRSDLADVWFLIGTGHELQAARYRHLAPAYA